jgi:hypothetical protein
MELIHTWTSNFGIGIDLVCAAWWLIVLLFVDGFRFRIKKQEFLFVIGFLIGAILLFFSRNLGIKIGVLNFESIVFLIGVHITICMLRVSISPD